jgi:iron complex transport system substrate-binding protein
MIRTLLTAVLVAFTAALTGAPHAQTSQTPSAATARPARIVSMIPAVTEMLFAMDAGSQVAAVSSFDTYPPEVSKLQRVGGLLDPDVERILALRPELVIVYRSQTELQEQLRRAGIPTFLYAHGGLRDVTATMRRLGAQVGRTQEAERAASAIEARLQQLGQHAANQPRTKTMVVFGREEGALRGIYASGGVGFLHDLVELVGGSNVFGEVKRESIQVSTELIIARRPDVIVELRFAPLDAAAMQAELDVWKVLGSVPAVRNGRVHIIADPKMVVPGPRVAEAAELLARAIHGATSARQPLSH